MPNLLNLTGLYGHLPLGQTQEHSKLSPIDAHGSIEPATASPSQEACCCNHGSSEPGMDASGFNFVQDACSHKRGTSEHRADTASHGTPARAAPRNSMPNHTWLLQLELCPPVCRGHAILWLTDNTTSQHSADAWELGTPHTGRRRLTHVTPPPTMRAP